DFMNIIRSKMIVNLLIVSLISITVSSYADSGESEICMFVFYEEDCENCQYIIYEFLPQIISEYQDRVSIRYFDISKIENYEALVKLEEAFNSTDNEFPIMVIGNFLLGFEAIEVELETILDKYSKDGIPFQRIDLIKDAQYTEKPIWEEQIEKEGKKHELPEVYLAYFYESGCPKCDRAEYQIKYLQWKYPNLVVKKFNIADRETKKLVEALGEIYNVPDIKRMATPSVYTGQDYLITDDINDKNLIELIERYRYKGTKPPWEDAEDYLKEAEKNIISRFKGLEITTVFIAGLTDGVNPCAFVTIIFFISYLALIGRKGRALLLVGLTFTSAVFITYLLIGLGFLKFIQSLFFIPILARIVYIFTAGVAIVLGGLCIYDYTKYKKGDYDESILKLPDFLHKKIHKVIHEKSKMKNYLLAAFITGIFISLLEFACTGQVYLPTIVFVSNIPSLKVRAVFYLLLYNFCFVIPLIFIFILAYKGMTSEHLTAVWKKKGKIVKLIMALIFFCLAGFLIFYIL
ncbi:hypothetical protein KAX35_09785, partial [candidate division WOR-3 bacterium]|nr:hypothetical protein [candidate division WOR-3 bacterium]